MSSNNSLTRSTTISRTSDILFDRIDDEIVMLNMEKGRYHALDPIAGVIWEKIATPTKVSDLVAALTAEFDVSPEQCEQDVLAYLADLQERDLLVFTD
jgi:hypothetical protein